MVAVFQPNYLGKMLGFSHVEPEPKRVVYDRPDGPSSPFSSGCKWTKDLIMTVQVDDKAA